MNELKDLYTISCEEYYLDIYSPSYEGGGPDNKEYDEGKCFLL